jgi:hypothetical protein
MWLWLWHTEVLGGLSSYCTDKLTCLHCLIANRERQKTKPESKHWSDIIKLRYSGLWHRVVFQTNTDDSKKHSSSISRAEYGGNMLQCSTETLSVQMERLIKKLRGLSRRANYTDRATAAWRRSECQFFCGQRVPRGQRDGSLRSYSRLSRPEPLLSI